MGDIETITGDQVPAGVVSGRVSAQVGNYSVSIDENGVVRTTGSVKAGQVGVSITDTDGVLSVKPSLSKGPVKISPGTTSWKVDLGIVQFGETHRKDGTYGTFSVGRKGVSVGFEIDKNNAKSNLYAHGTQKYELLNATGDVIGYTYYTPAIHSGAHWHVIEKVDLEGNLLEDPVIKEMSAYQARMYASGVPNKCFSYETPISLPNGSSLPISQIKVGDTVLAYDASDQSVNGKLVPRKVTRLYRNITNEWLKLTWIENGRNKEIISTPGHHFLNQFGQFPTIEEMLEQGKATVVLASGVLTEVTAERIIYSTETAHLFEQAYAYGMVAGNAALNPAPMDGWQTYNFEVEDLHTYVANGVRVHNDSGLLGAIGNGIDSVFNAIGLDKLGDFLTHPLHEVGSHINGLRSSTALNRKYYNATGSQVYQMTKGATHINELTGATVDMKRFNQTYGEYGNPTGATKVAYGGGFKYVDNKTGQDYNGGRDRDGDGDIDRSDKHRGDAEMLDRHAANHRRKGNDAKADAYEARADRAREKANGGGGGGSGSGKPIVVDLDGDGVEISTLDTSTASFDFDNDGFKERTAWVGRDDGLLMFDVGNDGKVTDAKEIAFANWTADETDTDLDGLRATFDSNKDGVLDAKDSKWNQFKIWKDANQNGEVDDGELLTLQETGIRSFGLERKENTAVLFGDGTALHGLIDIEKTDGTSVLGGDFAFAYLKDGMRKTVDAAGSIRLEFENSDTAEYKKLTASQINFSLGADASDFRGAFGNARNNLLDGSQKIGAVILDGQGGNDTLLGGDGDDVLSGGAGSDRIQAGIGHDIVHADKHDVFYKSGAANISGGEGYDQLIMAADARLSTTNMDFYGFEAVSAGDLNDSIRATDKDVNHQFHGNGGNDTLAGAGGDDLLSGGAGADYLEGSYGSDVLSGGAGNDVLKGGDDDDVYVFGRGDGKDTVLDQVIGTHQAEYDYTAVIKTGGKNSKTLTESRTGVKTISGEHDGGIDVLQFGQGITVEDVRMRRSGSNMIVDLRQEDNAHALTGDQVTIQQWDDTDNRVEYLRFVDGTLLDVSQVIQGRIGGAGNDNITGAGTGDFITTGNGHDIVNAGAGADYITGGLGNDKLNGQDGEDIIWAGEGNDAVTGGKGRDFVQGGAGNDTVDGGDGDDYLLGEAGNDKLVGGAGKDILVGGIGADNLNGGAGDDTYMYLRGDGKDTIHDQHTVQEAYQEAYTVKVQRSGKWGASWVNETRTRAKVRTVEQDGGLDTLQFGYGITLDGLAFDRSGTSLRIGLRDSANTTMASLDNVVTIQEWTDKKNRIETIKLADGTLLDTTDVTYARSGYAGNDVFNGTAGGDILSGGAGNDRLQALDGADYLIGGDGADYLDGGKGDDDLYGGNGMDSLFGGEGDDYLLGANGNDQLNGGNGADVFIGGVGDDILKGGKGDDTYIFTRGAGKDIIDESNFNTTAYTYNERLQKTVEAFKTVTTYKTVGSGKNAVRKAFNTKVSNGTKKVWVNETRTGYRKTAIEGGKDTLQFAGNIAIADLLVNKVGNDLVVQLAPNTEGTAVQDQVTIKQWNYSQFRVESFVFQNGFSLETGKINYAKTGTGAVDAMTAVGGRESWLSGQGGNDRLTGSAYSDILIGGTGNDALNGGNGDDVYVYSLGDGKDTIIDSGSVRNGSNDLQLLNGDVFGDKIVFGAGISIEHISLVRSGNDLRIYVRDPAAETWEATNAIQDVVTVKNWHNANSRIEALQFYDGTDLDISNVVYAWTGGTGNDNLNRTNYGDWADGGLGNDTIHGLGGDDYLFGREGNDKLYGGAGHDVLAGGAGDDLLNGGAGEDFLIGGVGNDNLSGGASKDVLLGGEGADTMNGGDGDDVMIGGDGNDVFVASRGQDIYRFGYGDGQDIYKGNNARYYSEDDFVILEGQLDKNAIWFKRIDNNLEMRLVGSEDKMTFEGWFNGSATGGAVDKDIAAFVIGDEILKAQDVNKLVSAMASFDPNDGTTAYGVKAHALPSQVQVAVNTAWQTM